MSLEEKVHKLSLIKSGGSDLKRYELECLESETIYLAANRQGFRLPVSCLNGVCHVCRAKLVSGSVLSGVDKKVLDQSLVGVSDTEIMLCQTWPNGQSEIEIKNLLGPGELPVKSVKCQVLAVERLKGYVYQVDFQLPAGRQPEFFPGQYLALQLPNKDDASYFSIASAPGGRRLTLHIQAGPHLVSAVEVIEFLNSCKEHRELISLTLPYGEACLRELPSQPLILIAAGTGFAQMKSIIEYLLEQQFTLPITLYWGVRKDDDMYLKPLAESWAQENENIRFIPLFADIENISVTDHHNQLSDAVLADKHDLSNAMVFVSGSPKLVFSAMDALIDAGLPTEQFFSDVLAYAKR